MDPLTVAQVQKNTVILEQQITALLLAFQKANPGCVIHSVPVDSTGTARVKVQIG